LFGGKDDLSRNRNNCQRRHEKQHRRGDMGQVFETDSDRNEQQQPVYGAAQKTVERRPVFNVA
jgi:hypothetical protein